MIQICEFRQIYPEQNTVYVVATIPKPNNAISAFLNSYTSEYMTKNGISVYYFEENIRILEYREKYVIYVGNLHELEKILGDYQ